MREQKIKQDQIPVGQNIRRIRKERGMGQTLVKMERGTQHITASQLKGIRDVLKTIYDELLREHS